MTSLFANPELGVDTLTPRPYQVDALEAIRREYRSGRRSTLVIHPTGLGKTVLLAKAARMTVEKGGKVLIVAHRGELIHQTANTLERVGIVPGIEKAESRARDYFEPDVVVGSVQTLQGPRLESWPADHFSLLVIDEAHHATAPTYGRIVRHFGRARVLGVTATPDRADDDRLCDVFESVAHEMTLWEAMTAPDPGPYLSRLKVVQADVQVDLRSIRTTGGDFNAAELEERIRPLVDTLANAIRKEVGDRPTIVFTPDVGSATAMANALRSLGMAADWVAGESRDRDAKVARYRGGESQVLVNCALLTEGFDAPRTAAVALCRPTQSRALFSQMVGRGTRLGKPDCLLVDFDFLTDRLDFCRPADLFDATGTDAEESQIVAELIRTSPGRDLVDVVERARAERRERQEMRIRAKEREVRYRRRVAFDPLSAAETLGITMRGSADARHDPPSPKQVAFLEKLGVADAASMSRRRANKLLSTLVPRMEKGLATLKQVAHLRAHGFDRDAALAMTKAEASAELDRIFGRAS